MRKILLIPKTHNPKALSLFLWSYSLLNMREKSIKIWETLQSYEIPVKGGVALGYNFPWQSSVFYVPRGTPNSIVTSFTVFALYHFKNRFRVSIDLRRFLPFYEKCLNIFKDEKGYLWMSYTPLDSLRIFNSSILGALAYGLCGGDENIPYEIAKTLKYYQNKSGSWIYGLDRITMNYVDNIHTAYNIWGMLGIRNLLKVNDFDDVILRAYEYYKRNLFDVKTGLPMSRLGRKRFDTHDIAVSIITFKIFRDYGRAKFLESWARENLVGKNGEVFNGYRDKRVFIRWSVAWLLLAFVFKPEYPFSLPSKWK